MVDHRWSERTSYDGNRVNWGLRYILQTAEKMLATPHFGSERSGITVYQGSWSNASASAGTHSGPSAVDTSPFNWRNRVLVLRLLGVAAWYRPRSSRWVAHIHGIVCGDDGVHWLAAQQVKEFWRVPPHDGLAGTRLDNGPKMYESRPLFVLPWKSTGPGDGKRYCKTACYTYTRCTTKAPTYGAKVAVGESFNVVAVVREARTNDLWAITATGRHLKESNFQRTPVVP